MRGHGQAWLGHGWLGAVLLTVLSLLVCSPALAQEGRPADIATARELFREGLELSKEEKWDEARVKLGQSLDLKQAALTYYTLAVADKNTGHLVAALEHFRGFLAQSITPKTERFVEPAREAVVELEKRVAGVTITIKPAGLQEIVVQLDDFALPLSALGRRRLIDPGKHTITAVADGYLAQSQKIEVAEGERRTLVLTLERAPEEPRPESAFPVVPVVLLGGGVALAVVGLALGIVGVGEAKDAPTSDGPEADEARTKTIIGDVLMGVGGATAAIGIVMLVLHVFAEDEPVAQSAIRPWAAGDAIGLELSF